MLESTNAPIRYGVYAGPSPAARWLAGKEGAVVALPLGERDTEVMLDGIAHFRPLVNGDSGFLPRPYNRAMELLEGPLTEEGLRFLRAVGVRHVLTRGESSRHSGRRVSAGSASSRCRRGPRRARSAWGPRRPALDARRGRARSRRVDAR